MKYKYKYKGVEIVLETDSLEDDTETRVNGWTVTVAGRLLVCALINNNTVLYLGDPIDHEPTETEGAYTIYAVDPGILHTYGRRFEVKPLSTGRGRAVSFDYRALVLTEDPPLEAVHPYVDHMLALRAVYSTDAVEKIMQGLVDDARRQPKA